MHDVQNIWHVPLVLESQGAHKSICKALNLGGSETMNLGFWRQGLAERWDNLAAVVRHYSFCHCSLTCTAIVSVPSGHMAHPEISMLTKPFCTNIVTEQSSNPAIDQDCSMIYW